MSLERYVTTLCVGDVRADALSDVVARLLELGSVRPRSWVSLDGGCGEVPQSLVVTYEVGPGGAAEDLWELRDVLEAVNGDLCEWTESRLGKPERAEAEAGRPA